MTGAHLHDDELTALALGELDPQQRGAAAAHLVRCADCRGTYDDLAAVVAGLLPATPSIQPPLGFDQRVARMLADRSATPAAAARATSRRAWPRRILAAAAAVLVVGGALVAGISLGDDRDATATRTLRTNDDRSVGTVTVSEVDGERLMLVAFTDAPEGPSYVCEARLSDGTVIRSQPWPSQTLGAWALPLPDDDREVDGVTLVVDGTDHVWSSASFE